MLTRSVILYLLLLAGLPASGAAQSVAFKGVVWTEPGDARDAHRDLVEMHRMGVNAVRTGIIQNRRVLQIGDSLGIHFFQELPLRFLPARSMLDSLAFARTQLRRVLERARHHPSARHFGLANQCDTSDLRIVRYLEDLVAMGREEGPAGTRFYYVTAFIESDQGTPAVDFVLINGLDSHDTESLLRRWRARHDRLAGFAKMGTWVRANNTAGYRHPHSLEAQARNLENNLRRVMIEHDEPPEFLFVYRWKDAYRAGATATVDGEDGHWRRYGLLSETGDIRPARDVVAGFYSSRKTLFAIPAGNASGERGTPWLILLGWMAVGVIGGVYAISPLYRQMLRRYAFSHGFYCQAVREGRELFFGTNVALLACQAISFGVTFTVIISSLQAARSFEAAASWLPPTFLDALIVLLSQPWIMVVLLAAIYGLMVVGWALWFVGLSSRGKMILPAQAVVLVVWPRWPLLFLMIGALVVTTLPDASLAPAALALFAGWAVIEVVIAIRTLGDLARTTQAPPASTLLMGSSLPFLIGAVVLYIAVTEFLPELTFLWHLMWRS